jgi:hypothetical protein
MPDHVRHAMAKAIAADHGSVSAGKAIYNSAIPSISKINSFRGAVKRYVESVTNPGLGDGIFFLPRADLAAFETQMTAFAAQLKPLAQAVGAARDAIMADARVRLNGAFDPSNYPANLASLYAMLWSYPSIEPDAGLPADVQDRQKQQLAAELDAAAHKAELALLEEFQDLVAHLRTVLTAPPGPDGKPLAWHATTLTKLQDFFGRARKLSVLQTPYLVDEVTSAARLVAGLKTADLKADAALRATVAVGLTEIQSRRPGGKPVNVDPVPAAPPTDPKPDPRIVNPAFDQQAQAALVC